MGGSLATSSFQPHIFQLIKEKYELKKNEGLSDEELFNFMKHFIENLQIPAQKISTIGPYPCIVAGPSGVGKGTLINKLISKFPTIFGFSVSHTTRQPRDGEINGVHYNFVSIEEFEAAVEKGAFIEYAKVHTNYYGTSYEAVDKVRSSGKVCILDIDIQGVQNVKKSQLDCKYLFIEPPSLMELENRLRGRNTETEDKIKIRLQNAAGELQYGKTEGNFDATITNSEIDQVMSDLIKILDSWYPNLNIHV